MENGNVGIGKKVGGYHAFGKCDPLLPKINRRRRCLSWPPLPIGNVLGFALGTRGRRGVVAFSLVGAGWDGSSGAWLLSGGNQDAAPCSQPITIYLKCSQCKMFSRELVL